MISENLVYTIKCKTLLIFLVQADVIAQRLPLEPESSEKSSIE